MSMTALLVLALAGLFSTAPLLIAVATAVLSRDPTRRADARRVVGMLRPSQPRRAQSRNRQVSVAAGVP
jgi:hypothetical protein